MFIYIIYKHVIVSPFKSKEFMSLISLFSLKTKKRRYISQLQIIIDCKLKIIIIIFNSKHDIRYRTLYTF